MRVWVGTDVAGLRALDCGEPLLGERISAQSEDEEHEHEAMLTAATAGSAVVVAEVDRHEDLTYLTVQAFHVDLDGSGLLAWFASQEIAQVITAVDRPPDDAELNPDN